ncbi:MAG: FG-GAP repeat protein [Alcanivoracaceae bacterium]|nr:FG-GAP repeat protein [Alcanivoracaceae bacterium]
MHKFNTFILSMVLIAHSPILEANTLQNNFDQLRPTDISDKKWSSLKTVVQEVKLLPSAGGGVDHNFGNSVSVDGNRMIVGAPNYSLNTIVHGAVYVFDFDGNQWSESQILTPFDGNNNDQFGVSVSLSGTRLLIGASKDDAGVVFVYDYNGVSWQFTKKLTADDAASGFKFGVSVSLSGNRALIGSDKAGADINVTTGAAYIFEFNNNIWSQTARLLASDADDADNFGVSVSLFGNQALIGNSNNDDAGNGSGSAYIFEFDGSDWLETQKLTADDAGFLHKFGSSVSLSNNRALIGASGESSSGINTGAAYVFNFNNNTWTQTQKLNATDAQANTKFGHSVSLIGNRVLITAIGDDSNGINTGAAYVFDLNVNSWAQTQKLTATDATQRDQFGFAASLSNDRVVIGAPFDDSNGDNSGSVYVFDKNSSNWNQSQKLLAVAGNGGDKRFGFSVSISGNNALIGAPNDDSNGHDFGSAYIFNYEGSNWILSKKLTASDGALLDRFGNSVSLFGNRALIGAQTVDDNGTSSGSAYIFDFDGNSWNQSQKITALDADDFDLFGHSVSLSSNRALIGARDDDQNGFFSGSAYIFDFDGSTWNQTQKITAFDGDEFDEFGISVSLLGNRALIGARDNNGNTSGSAYIFDFDGNSWNQTKKFIPPGGGEQGDQFGIRVSLSVNRALIGATGDNGNSGSAYIFDFDGNIWNQTEKIIAPDGNFGDFFGNSVSLSGDRALIGSFRNDSNSIDSGSAYIFDFDGNSWNLTQNIIAPDGNFGDFFGQSVSLSGNRVLIGGDGTDDRGNNSGSAYIFTDNNDLIFENGFEN